jgi:hypothetical protein
MTARAALAKALLDGRVLNVKNCFETIGLTNCAREISRMIEQPFGVEVSRTRKDGKSRYGQDVTWVDYYLRKSEHNQDGIQKMKEYVEKEMKGLVVTPKKGSKQVTDVTENPLFKN